MGILQDKVKKEGNPTIPSILLGIIMAIVMFGACQLPALMITNTYLINNYPHHLFKCKWGIIFWLALLEKRA
jgi:hypothetical protein